MTEIRSRGRARPGQPLPPLSDRRTRVVLLAGSYLLACPCGNDRETQVAGKPHSRTLKHGDDLWPYGSYRQLEHVMDELRGHSRHLSHHFWLTHVTGRRSPVASERDAAYHALGWVTRRMPSSIYVPLAVSTGAGYLLGEAKAFATSHELKEEAS